MQFSDFTLVNGDILSFRRQETGDLAQIAIDKCRQMLKELRGGASRVAHNIPGMVPFEVSLGLPADLVPADYGDPALFFAVGMPGVDLPFQFNIVLPADHDPEIDQYAVGTIVALSNAGHEADWPTMEAAIKRIMSEAPSLATSLLPTGPVYSATFGETVQIAADFSTCFAAAMLLKFGA